jgi:hypothetical protein
LSTWNCLSKHDFIPDSKVFPYITSSLTNYSKSLEMHYYLENISHSILLLVWYFLVLLVLIVPTVETVLSASMVLTGEMELLVLMVLTALLSLTVIMVMATRQLLQTRMLFTYKSRKVNVQLNCDFSSDLGQHSIDLILIFHTHSLCSCVGIQHGAIK